MKKIYLSVLIGLLIILAAILLLSCASTKNIKKADNDYTIQNYDDCVDPIESYFINQFRARVHRHENCMGINDLLTVVWMGPLRESGVLAARFLAVIFAERQTSIDTESRQFSVWHLNTDTFPLKGHNGNIAFFEIKNNKQK